MKAITAEMVTNYLEEQIVEGNPTKVETLENGKLSIYISEDKALYQIVFNKVSGSMSLYGVLFPCEETRHYYVCSRLSTLVTSVTILKNITFHPMYEFYTDEDIYTYENLDMIDFVCIDGVCINKAPNDYFVSNDFYLLMQTEKGEKHKKIKPKKLKNGYVIKLDTEDYTDADKLKLGVMTNGKLKEFLFIYDFTAGSDVLPKVTIFIPFNTCKRIEKDIICVT